MEEEKKYREWENYQTWVVKTRIDEREEDKWIKRAKEILEEKKESPAWILADEMEEDFEEDIPKAIDFFWSLLLTNTLGKVDWYEIAESIINEVKDNEW